MAESSPKSYRARLKALFTVNEPPRIVAGSIAVALLCGTSPYFVGVVLLPILIRALGLNKVLAIGFTTLLLANPLMIFIMVGQIWLGLFLLGKPVPEWLFSFEVSTIMKAIKDSPGLLAAYAVGGYGSAIFSGALAFLALWGVLEWRAARKSASREDR